MQWQRPRESRGRKSRGRRRHRRSEAWLATRCHVTDNLHTRPPRKQKSAIIASQLSLRMIGSLSCATTALRSLRRCGHRARLPLKFMHRLLNSADTYTQAERTEKPRNINLKKEVRQHLGIIRINFLVASNVLINRVQKV